MHCWWISGKDWEGPCLWETSVKSFVITDRCSAPGSSPREWIDSFTESNKTLQLSVLTALLHSEQAFGIEIFICFLSCGLAILWYLCIPAFLVKPWLRNAEFLLSFVGTRLLKKDKGVHVGGETISLQHLKTSVYLVPGVLQALHSSPESPASWGSFTVQLPHNNVRRRV